MLHCRFRSEAASMWHAHFSLRCQRLKCSVDNQNVSFYQAGGVEHDAVLRKASVHRADLRRVSLNGPDGMWTNGASTVAAHTSVPMPTPTSTRTSMRMSVRRPTLTPSAMPPSSTARSMTDRSRPAAAAGKPHSGWTMHAQSHAVTVQRLRGPCCRRTVAAESVVQSLCRHCTVTVQPLHSNGTVNVAVPVQ